MTGEITTEQIAIVVIALSMGLYMIITIMRDAIKEQRRDKHDRGSVALIAMFVGFGALVLFLGVAVIVCGVRSWCP